MNFVEKSGINLEEIIDKVKNGQEPLSHLNIMIMGKTGVGKSTLINNVFSGNLADTGIGRPITSKIHEITKEGSPLSIYDTPGLELGGENSTDELLKEVNDTIREGYKLGTEHSIHCIWYCIATPSNRIEDAEISFMHKFIDDSGKYNVPVILVLTQSYAKSDAVKFKTYLQGQNLNVKGIVPVLAADYEIDDEFTMHSYGLPELLQVTEALLPEAIQLTLAAVQKADLNMKIKKSQFIIAGNAAAAAATGAVPIPVADSAVLIPQEVAMIVQITQVFGLPVSESTIMAIVTSTLGTAGATLLGKTVVTSILKCIPVYGSAVGGAISGTVAAIISTALGETYIGILVMVSKGQMKLSDLDTDQGREIIGKMFKQMLALKRNAKGERVDGKDPWVL